MPNQFTKAKDTGIPYIISEETRKKLSISTTRLNKIKWSNADNLEKQRKSMQLAAQRFPESYSSKNRGRTKQIEYDGLKFQGHWELDFYKWAKSTGICISKPTQGFPYTWNGVRTYYPDFFLEEYDLYIEVKGYETDRDNAKWSQFPARLSIIKSEEIKKIKKESFSIDDVLKNIYNKTLGL